MDYIRYHETEQLLKVYPVMTALAQSIRVELENLKESEGDMDDGIYALALKHAVTDEIPGYSVGAITDKTGNIGVSYKATLTSEKQIALCELRDELLIMEKTIDKINIGLHVIPELWRNILAAKYWKGETWTSISEKLIISESNGKALRKKAVERISRILRIDIPTYKEVMKLLNMEF